MVNEKFEIIEEKEKAEVLSESEIGVQKESGSGAEKEENQSN